MMSSTIQQSKRLEDYIHLYLGCECQVLLEDENGKFTIERKGELSWNHEEDSEWILITELPGDDDFDFDLHDFKWKLLLRPLSSMTEEEAKELDSEGSKGWRMINPPDSEKPHDLHLGVVHRQALEIKYLLSKHFDLFGLIDARLAIDKTKLNY